MEAYRHLLLNYSFLFCPFFIPVIRLKHGSAEAQSSTNECDIRNVLWEEGLQLRLSPFHLFAWGIRLFAYGNELKNRARAFFYTRAYLYPSRWLDKNLWSFIYEVKTGFFASALGPFFPLANLAM